MDVAALPDDCFASPSDEAIQARELILGRRIGDLFQSLEGARAASLHAVTAIKWTEIGVTDGHLAISELKSLLNKGHQCFEQNIRQLKVREELFLSEIDGHLSSLSQQHSELSTIELRAWPVKHAQLADLGTLSSILAVTTDTLGQKITAQRDQLKETLDDSLRDAVDELRAILATERADRQGSERLIRTLINSIQSKLLLL